MTLEQEAKFNKMLKGMGLSLPKARYGCQCVECRITELRRQRPSGDLGPFGDLGGFGAFG